MADKRRNKRKIQEEPEKPTKEEYAVAKYLRFTAPCKEGKLMNLPVQYFIASKAVDRLMESKWATNIRKTEALFTTRSACVEYCNRLLSKGIFHRALRQEKSKSKKKKKDEKSEKKEEKSVKTKVKSKKKDDKEETGSGDKKDTEKEEKEETKKDKKSGDESKEVEKKSEKKDEEKKKRRKLKLEMHDYQKFVDGDDVYVWIYDPVPLKNKIIGLFLVLGAIGVCLFPLWPPEVRIGVYYLSLAAAGFVGLILALCVVRLLLFGLVWGVTLGKHHLWIFPNLTEDVGIIDSFKPLYHHEVVAETEITLTTEEDKNTTNSGDGDKENKNAKESTKEGGESGKEEGAEGSGTEEGESGQSDSNGYEIVDHKDVHLHQD